jgi:hypothetical protein
MPSKPSPPVAPRRFAQTIRDNGRKSLFIAQLESCTPPESVVNTKCVDFRDVMPPGLKPTIHSYTDGEWILPTRFHARTP